MNWAWECVSIRSFFIPLNCLLATKLVFSKNAKSQGTEEVRQECDARFSMQDGCTGGPEVGVNSVFQAREQGTPQTYRQLPWFCRSRLLYSENAIAAKDPLACFSLSTAFLFAAANPKKRNQPHSTAKSPANSFVTTNNLPRRRSFFTNTHFVNNLRCGAANKR